MFIKKRLFNRYTWLVALLLSAICLGACEDKKPKIRYTQPVEEAQEDDEFQKAMKRPPEPKTLYALARIYVSQEKDAQAEFILHRIKKKQPKFMPTYCLLAEIYLRQRLIKKSMATLNEGLNLSPRDPVLHNNMGMCFMVQGRYNEALEKFREAAAYGGQETRYRANMAVALGMMGRYDESLALYHQILPPEEAHFNLGVLADARKDRQRAALEYQKAKMAKEDKEKYRELHQDKYYQE